MHRALALAGLALLLPGSAAAADPPRLRLPIACAPGETCWPVRYVDLDGTAGARDYHCRERTEDGHDGTDIAVRDLQAMAAGVEVLAAASGTVVRTRDGEPDVDVGSRGADSLDGRECGNGVRIDHGDGWATQYCHLRRGSVRVLPGDRVEAGQQVGLVGLSGLTSFPHLHFSVSSGGAAVDPFRGLAGGPACGTGSEPLWEPSVLNALTYPEIVLHSAGFAGAQPTAEDIRRGWFLDDEMPASTPALVLWVDAYWVEQGDLLTFTITGPDGAQLLEQRQAIEDDHRLYYAFAGRKRPGPAWPPGTYRGEVTLERKSDSGRPLEESLRREVVLR